MSVEKAVIINTETQEEVRVLFNPEEYTLNLGNEFAEVAVPGLRTPPIQFVRGQGKSLDMELFIDTYEARVDARRVTRQLASFLEKSEKTGAPPVLLFAWASLAFECVLARMGQRFTMFLDDGTPVRARLDVSFREYESVDVTIERGFFFGPPTVRTIVEGETVAQLAADVFGDPEMWRKIADANAIEDPLEPPAGMEITIPNESGDSP